MFEQHNDLDLTCSEVVHYRTGIESSDGVNFEIFHRFRFQGVNHGIALWRKHRRQWTTTAA
jgi:hypothetical protein